MSLAKKINIGDTIGFFSPSTPITKLAPKRFKRAQKFIESKGFFLEAGNLTKQNDFYRSGSIKDRANELNQLIRNPKVSCIISTIGGSNSNAILPYIDYQALKNNPKIIIGYSDVTAILLAIYSQINLITFYGPALVASFGEVGNIAEETYRYFENILINPKLNRTIQNPKQWTDEFIDWETQTSEKQTQANQLITVNEGIVTGRLIVANLNTILGIYGSKFMPTIKTGDILVIEDSLKNAATIERSFAHLKLNGVFDIIGGLILGKHEQFDDCGTGRKPYEILLEFINDKQFPFLAEYDCCHTHPMITLPIGTTATLDATNQTLTLIDEWII